MPESCFNIKNQMSAEEISKTIIEIFENSNVETKDSNEYILKKYFSYKSLSKKLIKNINLI